MSTPPPSCFKLSLRQKTTLRPGDYAVVNVRETSGITLRGSAVARTTLVEHDALRVDGEKRREPVTTESGGEEGRGTEVAAGGIPGDRRAFV